MTGALSTETSIGHLLRELAPQGDVVQPAARVGGDALRRPLRGGRDQRLLHRVLRGGEVAVAAGHRAEHLRREVAQQAPDGGLHVRHRHCFGALITCRTSMGMFSGAPPGPGAADAFAAIWYARSGESTSTIQ